MAIGTRKKATKTKLLARLNLISWRHGESPAAGDVQALPEGARGIEGFDRGRLDNRNSYPASRSVTPPSVLPDISPSRREIGCHAGFRQFQSLGKRYGAEAANLPLEAGQSHMAPRYAHLL